MSVDFEARYRAEGDPWGYETSAYERDKYAATLAACGPGPFARALELGGSIGVFSALLAPRYERLDTIDGAPSAVAAARARLAGHPGARAHDGAIPDDIPRGPFDLVVASEVLYYLDGPELDRTLSRLAEELRAGSRLVAVHWLPTGPDRPLTAGYVHGRLRGCAWLRPVEQRRSAYLLDVLERR